MYGISRYRWSDKIVRELSRRLKPLPFSCVPPIREQSRSTPSSGHIRACPGRCYLFVLVPSLCRIMGDHFTSPSKDRRTGVSVGLCPLKTRDRGEGKKRTPPPTGKGGAAAIPKSPVRLILAVLGDEFPFWHMICFRHVMIEVGNDRPRFVVSLNGDGIFWFHSYLSMPSILLCHIYYKQTYAAGRSSIERISEGYLMQIRVRPCLP